MPSSGTKTRSSPVDKQDSRSTQPEVRGHPSRSISNRNPRQVHRNPLKSRTNGIQIDISRPCRALDEEFRARAEARNSTSEPVDATALATDACQEGGASFERSCLTAGVATLVRMMEEDATQLCRRRHEQLAEKAAYRWGKTRGKIGFHGGKIAVDRTPWTPGTGSAQLSARHILDGLNCASAA